MKPYATTRLDALRNLRREGFVIVDREQCERLMRAKHRLATAEQIITMAAYSGSYEGDMLERMWAAAEAWLNDGDTDDADGGPRHPGDEFDPMERVGWPDGRSK